MSESTAPRPTDGGACSGSADEPAQSPGGEAGVVSPPRHSGQRWLALIWLPLPVLLVAAMTLGWAGPSGIRESRVLLLGLQFVFMTIASLLVAYLVGRGFFVTGSPSLLLLGCGAIIWSGTGELAVLVGGSDPNAVVTIHNVGVWLSGVCHLGGVLLSLRPTRTVRAAGLVLPAGYSTALAAMGALALVTHLGVLPTFFVQGQGGTLPRQLVLGSAVGMFGVASCVLALRAGSRRSAFDQWYSVALALVALGLAVVLLQSSMGSAVNWVGRAAQLLAGVYMVAAASAAQRESRVMSISLEASLRETEARFRSLVELAPDAIAAHQDGRFIYANSAALRLFGATRSEQLVGQRVLDFVHPDHRANVQERIRATSAGGTSPLREQHVLRLDGSDVPVEAVASGIDNDGRRATLVILRDIRERRAMARRADRRAAVLAGIARIFREALTCANEEELGAVCLAVAEEVTQSRFGIIGRVDKATGQLDDIAMSDPGWQQCRMRERPNHGRRLECGLEIRGMFGHVLRERKAFFTNDPPSHPSSAGLPEGHPPLTAFLGVPLLHGGEPVGLLAVGNREGGYTSEELEAAEALAPAIVQAFVSKRADEAVRSALEGLREADRQKNQFLAVLSHELRNPLTPIKNSLYILDRAAPGGEQAARARRVLGRQVDQLARLVDDLLDVTRITRGKIQLQRERLDLTEVVRRTLDDYASVFEDAKVQLALEVPPEPIHIDGDRNRIAQIVGNLLQNAAKFTGPAGRVAVSVAAEPASSRAIIRVTDTGVGMEPEVLQRLFQPFVQADGSLDRSKGGLGLGLALVKGLVELHAGEVSARSEGLGRGAEFTIRLPLEKQNPKPEA